MLVRPGSEADLRRRLQRYRRGRDSSILCEKGKEKYYAERREREGKNKAALLFFVDCLKEEFSDEHLEILSPVFDIWEKRRYAREAILAYHDIVNALGPRDAVLYKKLGRCQGRLKRFIISE